MAQMLLVFFLMLYFNTSDNQQSSLFKHQISMKKYALIAMVIAATASCKKTEVPKPGQAYTVNGIHDVTMVVPASSWGTNYAADVPMPISIDYNDSTQQKVTVAVTNSSSDIFVGTYNAVNKYYDFGPWSGYPSFSIPITISQMSQNVVPGASYPVTITTSSGGVSRSYSFVVSFKK